MGPYLFHTVKKNYIKTISFLKMRVAGHEQAQNESDIQEYDVIIVKSLLTIIKVLGVAFTRHSKIVLRLH
jgi:hypothetical protein